MGQYFGPKTVKLVKKEGALYITIGSGDPRRMPSIAAAIDWAAKYGCTIPQEEIDACR